MITFISNIKNGYVMMKQTGHAAECQPQKKKKKKPNWHVFK